MSQTVRSPKQMGSLIQRIRKQRGLTQTDLANLAGLRQELISKIEGGHESAKLSTIYALFASLGLELLVDARHGKPTKDIEDIF